MSYETILVLNRFPLYKKTWLFDLSLVSIIVPYKAMQNLN